MIYWPEDLPAPQFGIEFNPRDPQIRTQMQSGRTFSRRNFTAVPVDFSARWILTSDQAVEFESFYKSDTEDGTKWFTMPLLFPQGEIDSVVRFEGIYTYKRVGPCMWEYSADMQMYLRPGEQMPADRDVYRVTESGSFRILE